MPEETRSALLHAELADLYNRARRAINEAHDLAADRDFILWWCGMRSRSGKPPSPLLDG
jgi:hypothetical protein